MNAIYQIIQHIQESNKSSVICEFEIGKRCGSCQCSDCIAKDSCVFGCTNPCRKSMKNCMIAPVMSGTKEGRE